MSSGDKMALAALALFFGFLLGKGILDYQVKKLQFEELKIQKECVCK
jgi:hypothetical protein